MTRHSEPLADYFEALARLQAGRPVNVTRGLRITNDSVALEAGRAKGSIKKSRPSFSELIQAISAAAVAQADSSPEKQQQARLAKIKGTVQMHRNDVDAAMSSLVSRLYEIHELKVKVRALEAQVQDLTERLSKKAIRNIEQQKLKGV